MEKSIILYNNNNNNNNNTNKNNKNKKILYRRSFSDSVLRDITYTDSRGNSPTVDVKTIFSSTVQIEKTISNASRNISITNNTNTNTNTNNTNTNNTKNQLNGLQTFTNINITNISFNTGLGSESSLDYINSSDTTKDIHQNNHQINNKNIYTKNYINNNNSYIDISSNSGTSSPFQITPVSSPEKQNLEMDQQLETKQNLKMNQQVETKQNPEMVQQLETKQSSEMVQQLETKQNPEMVQQLETEQNPEMFQQLETKQNPEMFQQLETKQNSEMVQQLETEQNPEMVQQLETEQNPEMFQQLEAEQISETEQKLQIKSYNNSVQPMQPQKIENKIEKLGNQINDKKNTTDAIETPILTDFPTKDNVFALSTQKDFNANSNSKSRASLNSSINIHTNSPNFSYPLSPNQDSNSRSSSPTPRKHLSNDLPTSSSRIYLSSLQDSENKSLNLSQIISEDIPLYNSKKDDQIDTFTKEIKTNSFAFENENVNRDKNPPLTLDTSIAISPPKLNSSFNIHSKPLSPLRINKQPHSILSNPILSNQVADQSISRSDSLSKLKGPRSIQSIQSIPSSSIPTPDSSSDSSSDSAESLNLNSSDLNLSSTSNSSSSLALDSLLTTSPTHSNNSTESQSSSDPKTQYNRDISTNSIKSLKKKVTFHDIPKIMEYEAPTPEMNMDSLSDSSSSSLSTDLDSENEMDDDLINAPIIEPYDHVFNQNLSFSEASNINNITPLQHNSTGRPLPQIPINVDQSVVHSEVLNPYVEIQENLIEQTPSLSLENQSNFVHSSASSHSTENVLNNFHLQTHPQQNSIHSIKELDNEYIIDQISKFDIHSDDSMEADLTQEIEPLHPDHSSAKTKAKNKNIESTNHSMLNSLNDQLSLKPTGQESTHVRIPSVESQRFDNGVDITSDTNKIKKNTDDQLFFSNVSSELPSPPMYSSAFKLESLPNKTDKCRNSVQIPQRELTSDIPSDKMNDFTNSNIKTADLRQNNMEHEKDNSFQVQNKVKESNENAFDLRKSQRKVSPTYKLSLGLTECDTSLDLHNYCSFEESEKLSKNDNKTTVRKSFNAGSNEPGTPPSQVFDQKAFEKALPSSKIYKQTEDVSDTSFDDDATGETVSPSKQTISGHNGMKTHVSMNNKDFKKFAMMQNIAKHSENDVVFTSPTKLFKSLKDDHSLKDIFAIHSLLAYLSAPILNVEETGSFSRELDMELDKVFGTEKKSYRTLNYNPVVYASTTDEVNSKTLEELNSSFDKDTNKNNHLTQPTASERKVPSFILTGDELIETTHENNERNVSSSTQSKRSNSRSINSNNLDNNSFVESNYPSSSITSSQAIRGSTQDIQHEVGQAQTAQITKAVPVNHNTNDTDLVEPSSRVPSLMINDDSTSTNTNSGTNSLNSKNHENNFLQDNSEPHHSLDVDKERFTLQDNPAYNSPEQIHVEKPKVSMEGSIAFNRNSALFDNSSEIPNDNAPLSSDRGRLFVKIMSLKGITIPFPTDRQCKLTLTLDNGIHCVTTPYIDFTKQSCEINQEFELIVGEELEFILTLKAHVPKTITKKSHTKRHSGLSFARFFTSKKKRLAKAASQIEESDPCEGIIGINGSFGRSYISFDQYEKHVYGKPQIVNITCYNEWAIDDTVKPVPFSAPTRKVPYKIGTLEIQMLYIPRANRTEELPKSLNACIRELQNVAWLYEKKMEGYLYQFGADCSRPKCRFFNLIGPHLRSHQESSLKLRATINLSNVAHVFRTDSLTDENRNGNGKCFRIKFNNGEIIDFMAENTELRDKWVKAIEEALSHPFVSRKEWVDLILSKRNEDSQKAQSRKSMVLF